MRERRRSFNKREFYKKRRYKPYRSFSKSKKTYRPKKRPYYQKRAKKLAKPAEQNVAEGIFGGLWWLVSWPFRRGKIKKAELKSLDKKRVQEWWQKIEEMEERRDFRGVAVEANKVFEYVLRQMFKGESFPERMNEARSRFSKSTFDALWQARKARNRIVHEAEHEINSHEVRSIKEKFRRGLKELNVL